MRKYARQDANHKAIRGAFESLGCSVASLSSLGGGIPDLLVGYGGLCIAVEVKDASKPPSARKLTPDEERFRMNWKGGYRLVQNLDDVTETVEVLRRWHAVIRGTASDLVQQKSTPIAVERTDGSCPHCGVDVWRRCIPPYDHTKCSFYKAKSSLNPVSDDYQTVENDSTRRGD